jgi:hypothetical protein
MEDVKELSTTEIKKVLWREDISAPIFVLDDNRIYMPYYDEGIYGITLRWAKVKEKWEDLDEKEI